MNRKVTDILVSLSAFFLLTFSEVSAQTVRAPDESKATGNKVPNATFIDENGDTLTLESLAGLPLIISPIFTSCPHVCPAITASLMDALDGVEGTGKKFNVLSLSFDENDSPSDLREYRNKLQMPAEWLIASGPAENTAAVMKALDFQYVSLPEGGFAHANTVVFLSPELVISYYLHGLYYETDDVKAGLRTAYGQHSLVRRYRVRIMGLAAISVLALAAVLYVTRKKRRAPA